MLFTHSASWYFGWFPSWIPCANQHRCQMQLPAVWCLWYWASIGSPKTVGIPTVLKAYILCLDTDPVMMASTINRIHYIDNTYKCGPLPSLIKNNPTHNFLQDENFILMFWLQHTPILPCLLALKEKSGILCQMAVFLLYFIWAVQECREFVLELMTLTLPSNRTMMLHYMA